MLAVRSKSHARHSSRVSGQGLVQGNTFHCIPEAKRVIVAPRHDALPVRAEGHAAHPIRVTGQWIAPSCGLRSSGGPRRVVCSLPYRRAPASGATVEVIVNVAAQNVLVISDDAAASASILDALRQAPDGQPGMFWASSLVTGVARLLEGGIDAILLDLFLPDSKGIDSFDEIFVEARRIPILVFTDRENEEVARKAVQHGAKDRVLKGHIGQSAFVLVLQHIMARAAVEDALFVERERAQITLNSIGDAVISIDKAGYVTYLNPAAERLTGWSRQEIAGRMLAEVFHLIDGDSRILAPNPMEHAIHQNRIVGLPKHAVLIRRDGGESAIEDSIAPIYDQAGQIAGAVMVFRDVTHARAVELKLAHLAQHDMLTDLPNRKLLLERLNHAIALARRYGRRVAVLFIDLDRFKRINDARGHDIGDKVLQKVGKRLLAAVRASDTVSRHGGDEFVVVLSEVEQSQSAAQHAARMHAALTKPYAIQGRDLQVNVSIGVSIFPDDGEDADTLIKCADKAMYHAKRNGRGIYQMFNPEMKFGRAELQAT